MMKLPAMRLAMVFTLTLILCCAYRAMSQETAGPRPLTFALECAGGDCPLLQGAPQTAGMRSGYVRLKRGESVGWHTTGRHEEALTILQGIGRVQIKGRPDIPIHARMLTYIPPNTKHNVTNDEDEILEYTWVVAPASEGH